MVSEEFISFALDRAREDADERGKTIEFLFTAEQVARVYTRKTHRDHDGDGLWFQIKTGPIFNCLGERERVRKSCFSGAIEGDAARDIAAYVIMKLDGAEPENYGTTGTHDNAALLPLSTQEYQRQKAATEEEIERRRDAALQHSGLTIDISNGEMTISMSEEAHQHVAQQAAALGLDVETFMRRLMETVAERHLHMKKGEGKFTAHPPKTSRR